MGRVEHPSSNRPGSLQLVFCDLGTPKDTGEWSVYAELRDALADNGVPVEKVRFVHESRNDQQKGKLFAACRTDEIAVLIGSTERMGVGTNVQLRAVALHHLDCPWRPADLAQRDGRIIRQGNHNRSSPRSPDPALRHRRLIRRLQLANRREEGRIYRAGHARTTRHP